MLKACCDLLCVSSKEHPHPSKGKIKEMDLLLGEAEVCYSMSAVITFILCTKFDVNR